MTAPTTELLHTPQFSTTELAVDSALLQWAHNEINLESRKRRRQIIEESDQGLHLPPDKSPRKNDYQAQEIDTSKMSRGDLLSAYKRIWNNLDMTNPTDAKLEPFVWHKIREYQKNK
ncbi:hypothetical protein INT47_001044 [Mucor saturninus]|uniref:Uncharacterized protein n=1 Tax=Mucor saturninus TaxID=64648 RepID=A0A8H7QUF9_9FUNG|nr:hypothetical protein INT47_001044 [Mucor saturninus]